MPRLIFFSFVVSMGQIAAWWGKRTNETQNPKSRLFALLELRQVLSYSVLETGRNLRERERVG